MINLRANLTGIPREGATLSAEVQSTNGQETLFELTGHWVSSAVQEILNQVTGSLLGLPIKGEALLLRQTEKNLLVGRLDANQVKFNQQILDLWRRLGAEQLLGGELETLALLVEKEWPAGEKIPGAPRISLEFSLNNLEWDKPELKQVKEASVKLSLKNQELKIQNGRIVAGGYPILFSGQVKKLPTAPQLDLEFSFQPDLKILTQQLKLPEGWHLSGKVPTRLFLSGSPRKPSFQLEADLKKSKVGLGQLLQKSSSQPGSLKLAGQLAKGQLRLDQMRVTLSNFQLTGHGNFPLQNRGENFLLAIDPFEVTPLQDLSPLLSKIKLRGELQATIEAKKQDLHGTLHLNNVGSHFFNIVGDLRQTSGKVLLDDQGLKFHNLSAHLGQSPLTLNGTLTPWSEPQLDIDVQGEKVRAQDLIFPNRELTFYDLDGHLRINRNGIYFEPVKVRLEQDTRAKVSGKVENFKDPQVILDITAEQGDILQVIDLFKGPSRTPPKAEKVQHKPVIISVKAAKGTLGGLRFSNAEGLIKDHAGVFTLYPLNFQTGEGYCLARVEFDRNHPQGLLKISGHAEDIDATLLHGDIFKERGLIKGPLRGDFYVEGTPSDGRFWNSAVGGMHLQVNNGTLRKFRGLAKVFSILNVSQLFTFKLPDVDREGMPFTLLEGSVRFENGWMRTEDMRVIGEAMNLSLLGQQSLVEDRLDYHLGVMPLRTVDKVVTSIPIAGWVLAGEDKALFTAHFKIEGSSSSPKVTVVPVDSISGTVFGIVKRTLGLPGKLVKDIGSLFKDTPKKKREAPQ